MAKVYNSYVLQIDDFGRATVTQLLDKMEPNKQPWVKATKADKYLLYKFLLILQEAFAN